MEIPFPDDPTPISLDFLRRLDADPPATWIASPKYDGHRRILVKQSGGWQVFSKHRQGATKPLPATLAEALAALPVPEGTVFDAELMGTRGVAHDRTPRLLIFDLLMDKGRWLRSVPFKTRWELLAGLWASAQVVASIIAWEALGARFPVALVPQMTGGGLVDFFAQQMQDPLSEGLVIRHRDSTLLLDPRRVRQNPQVFKCKYRDLPEPKE